MKRRIVTISLVLVTLFLGALESIAFADEKIVQAVRVKGNRRVESDAIKVVIRSQPDEPLAKNKIATDIKAIYALGFFEDVRVELEKGKKGLILNYIVEEKPSIARIVYQDNNEVDDDKIKEVVDIKPMSVLDVAKIKKNAEKIKDLYVEKGFYLAEVDYKLKELPKNSAELTFVIREHAKVEIRRINFLGNKNLKDEELVNYMETREGNFFSFLTSWGTYKEDTLNRDVMRLTEYYYNNGYLNVKISEPIVEISPDRKYLYISIPVSEGQRYRIGKVGLSGDLLVDDPLLINRLEKAIEAQAENVLLPVDLAKKLRQDLSAQKVKALKLRALAQLLAEAKQRVAKGIKADEQKVRPRGKKRIDQVRQALLKVVKTNILEGLLEFESGEIFNKMNLSMSIFRLRDVYKNRGYAYADVIPETNINAEERIIDLNLVVQKGDKVFVERVEIKGNQKTRDKVIRRQIRIYEGEYYSGAGLEKSKRLINGLGFFEKVDVSEKRGSKPDRIVITFEVKERQTGTFQIGAGFSSVENFIATAQISQQNLFGRGQTLSLMAQLSSLRQYFSLQFVEPYFLDSRWYFAASVFNTQLDYINFLREATGGRLTLGYWFADDWRLSFTYKLEKVDVSAGRGTSSGIRNRNLFNDGFTSSLTATTLWDTRDNRLFPSDGQFLQASAEWASPYTLSENHFLRLSGVARYYLPVIWGIVLKTNLTLGYMISTSEKPLPIFEKYFVGGIYSVRGYEPRSLGPTEDQACDGYTPDSEICRGPAGGNKQFIANLELEFPIFPQVNIRGVVFLDAGNAYSENEQFFDQRISETGRVETVGGLYWSTGFGFRWFSPIGPLRFEWGIPLTRRPKSDYRPADKDILFEFTIGNFF